MKSKIKLFMILGCVCAAMALATIIMLRLHVHEIPEFKKNAMGLIVGVLTIVSLIIFGKAGILYYTGKLQRLAEDLSAGKCHWYLKSIADQFLAYPLYPEELQSDNLTLVSTEKIQSLLEAGKIDNSEAVEKVLDFMDAAEAE